MQSLPDNVEVFALNAEDVAQQDEDLVCEYMKRPEYRLAAMNGKTRDAMLAAMVKENGITGGWFYWLGETGCGMPDCGAVGPFTSRQEAEAAAIEDEAAMH